MMTACPPALDVASVLVRPGDGRSDVHRLRGAGPLRVMCPRLAALREGISPNLHALDSLMAPVHPELLSSRVAATTVPRSTAASLSTTRST